MQQAANASQKGTKNNHAQSFLSTPNQCNSRTSFYQMQILNEQNLTLHTLNRSFNVSSECKQCYQCM